MNKTEENSVFAPIKGMFQNNLTLTSVNLMIDTTTKSFMKQVMYLIVIAVICIVLVVFRSLFLPPTLILLGWQANTLVSKAQQVIVFVKLADTIKKKNEDDVRIMSGLPPLVESNNN